MATYFVSDTHFGHSNIIQYSKRPYRDANEMNEALISNWNQRVSAKDEVYHLGDFAFLPVPKAQAVLDRLQGRKHLVLGNHDKVAKKLTGWEWIKSYHEMYLDEHFLVLFHYGQRVWNRAHHGALMLYGHSHGNLPGDSQSLDVGVDCWDYTPVNLTQIKSRMATLPPHVWVDHHGVPD